MKMFKTLALAGALALGAASAAQATVIIYSAGHAINVAAAAAGGVTLAAGNSTSGFSNDLGTL